MKKFNGKNQPTEITALKKVNTRRNIVCLAWSVPIITGVSLPAHAATSTAQEISSPVGNFPLVCVPDQLESLLILQLPSAAPSGDPEQVEWQVYNGSEPEPSIYLEFVGAEEVSPGVFESQLSAELNANGGTVDIFDESVVGGCATELTGSGPITYTTSDGVTYTGTLSASWDGSDLVIAPMNLVVQ